MRPGRAPGVRLTTHVRDRSAEVATRKLTSGQRQARPAGEDWVWPETVCGGMDTVSCFF